MKPNANFTRLQDNYMQKLEKFANTYSDSLFAAEAMVQIALSYELAADEAKQSRGTIESSPILQILLTAKKQREPSTVSTSQ